jgi:hypothetical protein
MLEAGFSFEFPQWLQPPDVARSQPEGANYDFLNPQRLRPISLYHVANDANA